jgi:hypothetical protein
MVYVAPPLYWVATYRLVPYSAIDDLLDIAPPNGVNLIANKTVPVGLYFTTKLENIEPDPDVGIVIEEDTFPAPSIVTVEALT